MSSLSEKLQELKGKMNHSPVQPDRLTAKDQDELKRLEQLAEENLRPYLEQINSTLGLNGEIRGTECDHPGDLCKGLKLVWDRHGFTGRCFELGVRQGLFHQIYLRAGYGAHVVFSSLEEMNGSENINWRNDLEKYTQEYFTEHPTWLEYKR